MSPKNNLKDNGFDTRKVWDGENYFTVEDDYKDDYKIVYYECKSNKVIKKIISSYVNVVSVIHNLENNTTKLELELDNGQEIITQTFDRSILNSKEIAKLLDYGVSVEERNYKLLVRYIMLLEETAPHKLVYTKLGWGVYNGNQIFKTYVMRSKNGIFRHCSYDENGKLDVKPKGTLKQWAEMFRENVVGNTQLEFVAMTGFASPLLSCLNDKYDLSSVILHLSNFSSKGKTTSEMLAISAFANPAINKGTLITYNTTDNALIETLSSCNGITMAVDEAGMSISKDYNKQLYTICAGSSKRRLNGDSTLKEVKTYSSFVLLTGEFDIINDDTPMGVKARVFQLTDPLTKDAANSRAIKQTVLENYGVAGKRYINHLLTKDDDVIHKDYIKSMDKISGLIKRKSPLSDRMIEKLSIIHLTAVYANEAFAGYFQVDVEELAKYIAEIISKNALEDSPSDRLLNVIREEITLNNGRYRSSENTCVYNCYGSIAKKDDFVEVDVIGSEFIKLVTDKGFRDYKKILKQLKEKGILLSEDDRLTSRKVISKGSGQSVKCYSFLLEKEETDDDNSGKCPAYEIPPRAVELPDDLDDYDDLDEPFSVTYEED